MGAHYSSPIGWISIESCDDRITGLKILREAPSTISEPTPFTDRAFAQVMEYLRGERREFDLEIDISRCTTFQQRVLHELRKIPYGERRSYADIARAVGCLKGARAVGMANNRNPILLIIPCHRVVGTGGKMVGFAAGIDLKIKLLELEQKGATYSL